MRKFLIKILVIQVHNNESCKIEKCHKLGKGHSKSYRLNPYNPLSYVCLLLGSIICLIALGIIGFWRELDGNPFKWD